MDSSPTELRRRVSNKNTCSSADRRKRKSVRNESPKVHSSPVYSKRKRVESLSPGTTNAFSQDDSFLSNFVEEIDELEHKNKHISQGSEDMFADCTEMEVLSDGNKTKSQLICNDDVDSQSVLSLPLSVLDVRAKALADINEETRSEDVGISSVKFVNGCSEFPNQNLSSSSCDKGPFFGLPDIVRQLYKDIKGITELFPWQTKCLMSKAVQNKLNLLYSLPTSGGKTLVAEIVMLQELICYRKDVIFVLPYVSLVQEKIRSLSSFALELGFYLEEYAGPKGRFPPVKRRHKKSLFVCTIEKSHALFNSLVLEERVNEVGLIVIDEVHMLSELRGSHLESLVTKVKFMNKQKLKSTEQVQLVSMSATVGNLSELASFLESELFTDSWRPVPLEEYIKVGVEIFEVDHKSPDDLRLSRKLLLKHNNKKVRQLDEDHLTELVLEAFPEHSCLVFCDSKKRCENVADMLSKMIFNIPECSEKILNHRKAEKETLCAMLSVDGAGFMCPVLRKTIQFGIGYHHSGLTMDERKSLEEAFLNGTVGVLCCTSTLAAGVNLPARRVIIRSPNMGCVQLSHSQYKQMVGRAGRAGLDTKGEAFIMLKPAQTKLVREIVTAPLEHCFSSLHKSDRNGLAAFLLNCFHLGLVATTKQAQELMSLTLLSKQSNKLGVNLSKLLESSIMTLFEDGLITTESDVTQQTVEEMTVIKPTRLGRACIQGNIEVTMAGRLYEDLYKAMPCLAVDTCLHLLFLVTPYEMADNIPLNSSIFHQIYMKLNIPELAVAKNLGITEAKVVALMTGKEIPKSTKSAMSRFFLSLALFDLWNCSPMYSVSHKFSISRGEVQNLMSSASSFASSILHFCKEIEEFWAYQELLEPFTIRLSHCCTPELLPLLELPGVKTGRAKQLLEAGFGNLTSIAKAIPRDLVGQIPNFQFKAANMVIQAAKLKLLEKAERLRDEADSLLGL